jgi:hypothetical protein
LPTEAPNLVQGAKVGDDFMEGFMRIGNWLKPLRTKLLDSFNHQYRLVHCVLDQFVKRPLNGNGIHQSVSLGFPLLPSCRIDKD